MSDVVLVHSESAAGLLRRMFREMRPARRVHVFTNHDDYSHGPLGPAHDNEAFFRMREGYWKSLDLEDADILYDHDLNNDFLRMIDVFSKAERAEIWVGGGVQDTFYTIVTLHLLKASGADVSVIRIRHVTGKFAHEGLRGLAQDELEACYEAVEAIEVDWRVYDEAWQAVSIGAGRAIEPFLQSSDIPVAMSEALTTYLIRFPEFGGGLGSMDRALLGAGTTEMKPSACTVGKAMALGEPRNDVIGDMILFSRLIELGQRPDPWFRIEGDTRRMRSCTAQITANGKAAIEEYAVERL
jgi:hypothetical protein